MYNICFIILMCKFDVLMGLDSTFYSTEWKSGFCQVSIRF